MSEHTPTPWKVADETAVYALDTSGKTNRFYLGVQGGYSTFDTVRTSNEEIAANAAFIVRACNAHDDLVEALKYARDKADEYGSVINFALIDAALAKAEGRA